MPLSRRLAYPALALALLISGGVAGMHWLEGYSWAQALWFVTATVTTVGYGDLVPQTSAGRWLALILMPGGIGLFTYLVFTIMATVVEGHLSNAWGRRTTLRKIHELRQHVVICGAGRVGQAVLQRLQQEQIPFVVIERDAQRATSLQEAGLLVLVEDAMEDATLLKAGIENARGLVTCLPDDAANVFVVLTARGLNPSLFIVARSSMPGSEEKLRRAGADRVISPASIGGRRMAASILRPVSVEVIETLVEKGVEFDLEELQVAPASPLVGLSLRESRIKNEMGAYVLAIKRGGELLQNPSADTVLEAGDLLVAVGTPEQLARLEVVAGITSPLLTPGL